MKRALGGLLALLCLALPVAAQVRFSKEIAPIVVRRCVGCHGERANQGGWRAHTFANLRRPGASGSAMLVPGKPEASLLYQRVVTHDPALRMPRGDDPLANDDIGRLRRWILEGARFDGADPAMTLARLLGPRAHPAAPGAYRTPLPLFALALAPGGEMVAAGGYHEATLWDVGRGRLVRRLGGLPERIHALSFSRDGRTLLVAGGSPGEYGEAALLDLATGRRRVLDTFPDLALCATFSPDEKRIAVGSADASVRIYDTATGRALWTSQVHSDWVTALAFSPDARFVLSASRDHTVKVHEADSGTLFTTYNGHNRQIGEHRGQHSVYALAFGADPLRAISAGGGAWLQLWDPVQAQQESGDAGDMEERFARAGHARYLAHRATEPVFALTVAGGAVFAASGDGHVRRGDLTGNELVPFARAPDALYALSLDPASGRLAAGDARGTIHVWNSASGRRIASFPAWPRALKNR